PVWLLLVCRRAAQRRSTPRSAAARHRRGWRAAKWARARRHRCRRPAPRICACVLPPGIALAIRARAPRLVPARRRLTNCVPTRRAARFSRRQRTAPRAGAIAWLLPLPRSLVRRRRPGTLRAGRRAIVALPPDAWSRPRLARLAIRALIPA